MGEGWKLWASGIAYGLETGWTNLPYALLTHYRRLKLSDTEAMLLIHLLAFRQAEGNDFPTIEEIERRMSTPPGTVSSAIRRLLKEGWLSIDEVTDPSTGIQSERYNLTEMYKKLGTSLAEEVAEARKSNKRDLQEGIDQTDDERTSELEHNLFVVFEQEFARPLSPMECETISGWIDQDGYPEELILMALKEAVFAGKVHFRYIDRILLEWSRNRVRTVEDAKAYTQRFRGNVR